MIEQYSDLITSPERLEEGFGVQQMIKSMPTHIEEGSEWFFLPKRWLDKWETWCYVDVINAPLDEASVDLRSVERSTPGKIHFADLFKQPEDD